MNCYWHVVFDHGCATGLFKEVWVKAPAHLDVVGVEIGEPCMVARVERLHVRLTGVMLWRNLFHSLIVDRDCLE
jgi:hypothetical protein